MGSSTATVQGNSIKVTVADGRVGVTPLPSGGQAGQVLATDGSGNQYWTTPPQTNQRIIANVTWGDVTIPAGEAAALVTTIAGALPGNRVTVGWPNALPANVLDRAHVTADNQVTIYVYNQDSSAHDIPAQTLVVEVSQ